MSKSHRWMGLILFLISTGPAFSGRLNEAGTDNPLACLPASSLAYTRHNADRTSYTAVLKSGEAVYYNETNNAEAGDYSFTAHLFLFDENEMNDHQIRSKIEWFSKVIMGPEVYPEVKKYLDSVKDFTGDQKGAYHI